MSNPNYFIMKYINDSCRRAGLIFDLFKFRHFWQTEFEFVNALYESLEI